MSTITDKKITDGQRDAVRVQHQPNRLTGTPKQNQKVFDDYAELIREHFNDAMDAIDGRIATNDSDIEELKEINVSDAAESARESAEIASESAQTTQDMLGRVISIGNKTYTKTWNVTEEQDEFVFTADGYTYNESDTYEVFVNGLKLADSEFTRSENSVILNSSISGTGNTVEIIVTTNLKGKGIADTELNDDYTLTINYDDGTSMTTESIRGEKGEKGDKGDGVYDDTQVKTDIAVLDARMDTFTHLTEGSTTGDAELIDARIGANGVTYTSAGDAVRGQISDLNTDLNGIAGISYTTDVGYLDSNSTIHAPTGNKEVYTNKIPVIGGQTIQVTLSYTQPRAIWMCYGTWKETGEWLGRIVVVNSNNVQRYSGSITVPEGARYVLFSYRTFDDCTFVAKYASGIADNVVGLEKLKEDSSFVKTDYKDDFAIMAISVDTGQVYENKNCVSNKHFIYLPPQAKFRLTPIENNVVYRFVVIPYDENYNLLANGIINSYVTSFTREYVMPEGATYLRVIVRYDVLREMTSADIPIFEDAIVFNVVSGEQELHEKANVLQNKKADEVTDFASGAIAYFEDGGDNLPVKRMYMELPFSTGYGRISFKAYGKNMLDPSPYASYKQTDGSYRATVGTFYSTHIPIPTDLIGNEVTISAFIDMTKETGSNYLRVRANINGVEKYSSSGVANGAKGTSYLAVVPQSSNDYFYFDYGSGGGNYATISDLQIELGSFPTDYEEYVAPKSDWFDKGYTNISVYHGGEWDITGGKLIEKYDSDGTLLAEPTVYDIVPREFKTHYGGNTILASHGTVSVNYSADTLKHIEKIKNENSYLVNRNVKAVNHRGYNRIAPENTIEAFKLSKTMGFDIVETDVQFTSDGVAVLIHDFSINRTARNANGTEVSGTVNIADITYEQALTYDFGVYKGKNYKGVKIPKFDDFLTLCRNIGLYPYIEIKTGTQEQVESLVDMVNAHGMSGKVTYIADNTSRLVYVKNKDQKARLGYVVGNITQTQISSAVALRTTQNEVFLDSYPPTHEIANSCATNGLPIEVWTVDNEQSIRNLDPYVSGVTSDYLIAGKVLYEAII